MKIEKEYLPYVLFFITYVLGAFLNVLLQDSTLGASLFIGFCFFIAIMSINKKA